MSDETTVVRSSAELSMDDERIVWPIRHVRYADGSLVDHAGDRARNALSGQFGGFAWKGGCYDVTLRSVPAKPAAATCGEMFDASGVACNLPIGHVLLGGKHGVVAPAKPAAPVRALAPGWERLAVVGRSPSGTGPWVCFGGYPCQVPATFRKGVVGACELHASEMGVFEASGCIACGLTVCDCSTIPGATIAARVSERMRTEDVFAIADVPSPKPTGCPLCGRVEACGCSGTGARPQKPRTVGRYPRSDAQRWFNERGAERFQATQLGRAPGIDSERPEPRRLPRVPARYLPNDDPWLDLPDA